MSAVSVSLPRIDVGPMMAGELQHQNVKEMVDALSSGIPPILIGEHDFHPDILEDFRNAGHELASLTPEQLAERDLIDPFPLLRQIRGVCPFGMEMRPGQPKTRAAFYRAERIVDAENHPDAPFHLAPLLGNQESRYRMRFLLLDFQSAVENFLTRYYRALNAHLTPQDNGIATAFLRKGRFDGMLSHQAIWYPPELSFESDPFVNAEHTDSSETPLYFEDTQVLPPNEEKQPWLFVRVGSALVPVLPKRGEVVAAIGNGMEVITRGQLKATPHLVQVPNGGARGGRVAIQVFAGALATYRPWHSDDPRWLSEWTRYEYTMRIMAQNAGL